MIGLPKWFERRLNATQTTFAAWLAPALLTALLAGAADVNADADVAIENSVSALSASPRENAVSSSFDVKFQEAIDALRAKSLVSPAEFARLEAAAKAKAFTVGGLTDRYALEQLQKSLQKAVESGQTVNAWLTELENQFRAMGLSGVENNAWHMRLVFRQNAYQAYGAGRWKQMQAVKDRRPYWQYVTVGDDKVRPEHAALDGIIKRADDPFWQKYYPPNGFGCRCMVVSVSEAELAAEGLNVASDADIAERYAQLVPSSGGMPPLPKGFDFDPAAAFGIAA